MFDDWRTKRKLRGAATKADSEFRRQYEAGERGIERLMELHREKHTRELLLLQFESNQLVRRAEDYYGIDIPRTASWWWDDSDSGLPPENISHYLTRFGMVNVRDLIRDKRRQNFEWWYTKVVLSTLQVLIPILSLLVALVSVWKR